MRTLLALLIVTAAACAAERVTQSPADAVYRGGRIYTVDAERSWAEAVAIANGRFVAVGSDAEIAPFVGPKTRVVELQGRMVLPGIHDVHAHPVDGGFQALVECSFPFTTPLDAILERIRACAAKTPKGEWIRGGQWAAETLETAIGRRRARGSTRRRRITPCS